MSAYVGVDAGGTGSRAVVIDASGRELARAEGAAALADPVHPEAAAGPITETVITALEAAGVSRPARSLWAGVAGTGREAVRSSVQLVLERRDLADRVHVGTDAEAAFHDAFGGDAGILLVAGTGSVAWGRSPEGRQGRVGGWGTLLGDEGSGYAIGLEGLRRVARTADGRGPDTVLREALLGATGRSDVDGLVRWIAETEKSEVAALAPLVVRAARGGDAVAGEILVKAVEELAGHVLTVLSNLGPWPFPPKVALAGGLLRKGGPLRRAVEVALSEQALRVLDRDPDAALGAARLALAE